MSVNQQTLKLIKRSLRANFLKTPEETKELALQYGLWDWLKKDIYEKVKISLARKDANTFIEGIMISPETQEAIKQESFHREWQGLITDEKRVLICAPRSHGKTIQVAGRIVWELGKNPNIRIKIIGSGDDKAKEILGLVKDIIRDNEFCHKVFPNLIINTKQFDTSEKFFVYRSIQQRDPSVEASGWSSAGAGGRADILVCDDVVDPRNAIINPTLREQVKEVVKSTWFSLVSVRGQIIWICTPYHKLDASHEFKSMSISYDQYKTGLTPNNNTPWVCWWTPAIRYVERMDPETGDPLLQPKIDPVTNSPVTDPESGIVTYESIKDEIILWPNYWSKERLLDRRATIGARTFDRQFLLNSMSDEERTFAEASLRNAFDITRRNIGDDIPDSWPTFGGIDLASTLSERGAWTVIWTVARNPDNRKIYLKEMIRKKIRFTQVLGEIERAFERHKWRKAFVESNGFQMAVEDSMANMDEYIHIPIEGFTTNAFNKHDQMMGLPGLDTAFDKGLIQIPAARLDKDGQLPSDDGSDIAIFLNELRTHPGGENSDTVMGFWFAYRAAIEGNDSFVASYLAALAE